MKYKVQWTETTDKEQIVEAENDEDAYMIVMNENVGEPTILNHGLETTLITEIE